MNAKIQVVAIKDGKLFPFESAHDAQRKLRPIGFKVHERNIRYCFTGRCKTCGGFMWFHADEPEKYGKYLF